MAFSPSLMPTITDQTPPPLNSSGPVESRAQFSASLSFQVPRAVRWGAGLLIGFYGIYIAAG